MKYRGYIISDIHVGAMDLETLYNEYTELFINRIKKDTKLDFVIVCGDFFDHKFYLNDNAAKMSYKMLKDLIEVCKDKDIPLRFVYGTESHECNQYDIMNVMKIYDNVKVVKFVSDEELLPNLNILYLPEEHVNNIDDYYDKYLSNYDKYDYVFGHGVIREVMTDLSVHIDNKSDDKRKKTKVFTTKELDNVCKGEVYFGHYHINIETDDKFFSIGSFSRWRYGEEERKGFYIVEYNTDKEKYSHEYIENTLAKDYKTIRIGYNNEVFTNEDKLKESIDGFNNMIKREAYDNIRVVFNIPSNIEHPESTINYIKETLKKSDNIKVEIVNGYIDEKRKIQKEKVNETNQLYSFIFDKNLPLEDKTSKFISITYNKEISSIDIKKYLYQPLNEII
jgi:calcineurin-like phosphoesterase|nr:MAG TPA: exonuclease subunit SbcD recombination 11-like protein [Caudoviricetes sp.]